MATLAAISSRRALKPDCALSKASIIALLELRLLPQPAYVGLLEQYSPGRPLGHRFRHPDWPMRLHFSLPSPADQRSPPVLHRGGAGRPFPRRRVGGKDWLWP